MLRKCLSPRDIECYHAYPRLVDPKLEKNHYKNRAPQMVPMGRIPGPGSPPIGRLGGVELEEIENFSREDWIRMQDQDPVLYRVKVLLRSPEGGVPDETALRADQPEVKAYMHLGSSLRLMGELLVKEVFIPMPREVRTSVVKGDQGEEIEEMSFSHGEVCHAIVVPGEVRLSLFQQWHGRPEQGHLCYKRVYPQLRERFFWMGMARDITMWLRACDSCQRIKSLGKHGTQMPMKTELPGAPMERVATDIMGPWPTTPEGKRFVLIYQDCYSNWIELFALRRHDAVTVATVLVNEVISRYGVMQRLHSDQGREYESALYQEMCRMWRVKKTRTAPYTPWSNGKLERVNQTVKTMVKHYVDSSQNTWDRFLPMLRMAYNFTVHDTTKCTPFRLMFSRCSEPMVPLDLVYGTVRPDIGGTCPLSFCEEQRLKGRRIFDVVRQITKKSVESQKFYKDRKGVKVRVYQPGEMVLREYPPLSQTKLGPKYQGPWVVMTMVDTHNVEITRGGSPIVVHVSCLKPYKLQGRGEIGGE